MSVFAITNKVFLIFSALIPAYIFFKEKINFLDSLKSFAFLFLIIWTVKNILISGCIIYPLKTTCFENLDWTNYSQIEKEQLSGEVWSKGWPQREDTSISMNDYNKNFYWLKTWFDGHFKNFYKIILIYTTLIISIGILAKGKEKYQIENEKFLIILSFSFLGILFFFIKFPLFRYGYSYIITLISLLVIKFMFYKLDRIKFFKISKVVMILCLITISIKQFQRIYKYHDVRNIVPQIMLVEDNQIKNKYRKIKVSPEFYYFLSKGECMYKFAPCTHQKPEKLFFKNRYNFKILSPNENN